MDLHVCFCDGSFTWAQVQQDHMHKSSCLLYHKKSRLLKFFCSISCVFCDLVGYQSVLWFCDLVGYQNQVYNVRILQLWFSTLITCGNYLGKLKNADTWVPPFQVSFDWFGVWPGPQFPQWCHSLVQVRLIRLKDSILGTHSEPTQFKCIIAFCHFFKLLRSLVIVITLIWIF